MFLLLNEFVGFGLVYCNNDNHVAFVVHIICNCFPRFARAQRTLLEPQINYMHVMWLFYFHCAKKSDIRYRTCSGKEMVMIHFIDSQCVTVRAVYLSIHFNNFIIVFITNGNLYLCDVKPETHVPIHIHKYVELIRWIIFSRSISGINCQIIYCTFMYS